MDEVTPPSDPSAAPTTLLRDLRVEHVAHTLDRLRHASERLQDLEARLGATADEWSRMLDRWARHEQRHGSAAVELRARLGEWTDLERRLLDQSAERLRRFEDQLQREARDERERREQPVRQLERQAGRIGDACFQAVESALRGLHAAEARLDQIEQQVTREMGHVAREVREGLAQFAGRPLSTRGAPVFERLPSSHDPLHAEADDRDAAALSRPGDNAPPAPGEPAAAPEPDLSTIPAVTEAPDPAVLALFRPQADASSTGGALSGPGTAASGRSTPRGGRHVHAAVGLAILAAMALVGWFGYTSLQARAAARDAAARVEAAERELGEVRVHARDGMEAARRAADASAAALRQSAQAAQAIASILAATDLLRFELAPASAAAGDGPAIVLVSRRQGVAVAATRLVAPPKGWEYQLWLMAPGRAVATGLLRPDDGGRANAAFDLPADLPRPLLGALLTLEPAGGSSEPSGEVVFRRAARPPDATPPPVPQS
jgi:hypothetical protein